MLIRLFFSGRGAVIKKVSVFISWVSCVGVCGVARIVTRSMCLFATRGVLSR